MIEVKVEKPAVAKGTGRNRYSGRGGYKQMDKPVNLKIPEFEGRCDALKGFIFNCLDRKQTDMYNNSMKEFVRYVGREYLNGGDTKSTIENEKLYVIAIPKDPVVADGETESSASTKRIWERQLDEYARRDNHLTSNFQSAYSLMLGQCTDVMIASLKGLKTYEKMNESSNLLGLMKAIKGLIYNFNGQWYHTISLHLEKKRWFALYQGRDTSNASYLEKFNTCVYVIEKIDGELGVDSEGVKAELAIMKIDLTNASGFQVLTATVFARDKCLAVAYLSGADKAHYGRLVEDLENYFTKGNNTYPGTLNSAYNLSVNYRNYQRPASRIFNDSEGMTFANVEKG
jgi:hypothetical protein